MDSGLRHAHAEHSDGRLGWLLGDVRLSPFSTLDPKPKPLNPKPSTLNPQSSTLNPKP